jgi:hypothetical protein
MKSTFLIIPLMILLFSCNEVTDSNKDKILLTPKYELVGSVCLDSNCQNVIYVAKDSVSQIEMPQGRLTYPLGFALNDSVLFTMFTPTFDTVFWEPRKIASYFVDSTVLFSKPLRYPYRGYIYSAVRLYRNNNLLWMGRDSIYIK